MQVIELFARAVLFFWGCLLIVTLTVTPIALAIGWPLATVYTYGASAGLFLSVFGTAMSMIENDSVIVDFFSRRLSELKKPSLSEELKRMEELEKTIAVLAAKVGKQ